MILLAVAESVVASCRAVRPGSAYAAASPAPRSAFTTASRNRPLGLGDLRAGEGRADLEGVPPTRPRGSSR
jgi:hypothetical protein